ncbi:MAG: AI-2E family transporter [Bdellovibrionota bacterium]
MNDSLRNGFYRPVQQGLLIIFFAVVFFGLTAAVYSVRWIAMAALIGVGLGVLVAPLMRTLKEKLHIPRAIGAALFFILLVGSLSGLIYLLVRLVSEQVVPLAQQLPELLSTVKTRLASLFERYPWIQRQVQNFSFANTFRDSAGAVFTGIQFGASAIGGFFFIVIASLYIAVNPGSYLSGFLSLFPSHMRPKTKRVLEASATTLRQWFGSQLIAMTMVGTLTSLGLWILGVDYWPLFGVLTAIVDIVPYIGPFFALIAISLVSFGTQPDQVPWIVGLFLVNQQIESQIIIPLTMKGRIELPPVQLMTTMLVFGSWFGLLGVFVAPPLFAIARTVYLMTYVPVMNRRMLPPDITAPKAAQDQTRSAS